MARADTSVGTARVALVTGAARGIGAATALRLVQAGHRVVGTWRSTPPDPALVEAGVEFEQVDIDDGAAIESCIDRIEARFGPVQILVSSAGRFDDHPLPFLTDEQFVEVLTTDLVGPFRLCRRVATGMRAARWGRIVLISSVSAATGLAGQANYSAAKAGLVGLARTAAIELGNRGVTANVVAPGPIATDLFAGVTDAQRQWWIDRVPLDRLGTAEEVAAAIAFLASERSGFISGAVVPVDGGLLALGGFGR